MAERAFCGLKAQVVADEGVGTDIPTTLVTVRGNQFIEAYPLVGPGQAPVVIATAIMLSDADRAYVGCDVYYELDPASPQLHGDLARRFADGDPGVREAVTVIGVHESCESTAIFRTYTYSGRTVVWEERGVLDCGSAYIGALQLAFRERNRNPHPLIRPGGRVHLLGEMPAPDCRLGLLFALSTDCPCGSRRAIEDCCSVRN